MDLSLYGREGNTIVEGVAELKCLEIHLHQTYKDWPAIRQNMKRARKVWGRLESMLRSEVADTQVSEVFYRVVIQEVLLCVFYLCFM